jgi:hypothetical protein
MEFKSQLGQEFSPHCPDGFWVPSSLQSNGTEGSFHRGKAGYSPPPTAKFKNIWMYIYTPPYTFMV